MTTIEDAIAKLSKVTTKDRARILRDMRNPDRATSTPTTGHYTITFDVTGRTR